MLTAHEDRSPLAGTHFHQISDMFALDLSHFSVFLFDSRTTAYIQDCRLFLRIMSLLETSHQKITHSSPVNRQSRSCKVCRLRKVKCDRVKPCHACCAHGYPSQCVYEAIPGDEPVSQADEIRNLRAEVHELRLRRDNRDHHLRNQQRYLHLRHLFDSIRSAPLQELDHIIGKLRNPRRGWRRPNGPVGKDTATLAIHRVSSDDEEDLIPLDDGTYSYNDSNSTTTSSTSSIRSTPSDDTEASYGRPLSPFSPNKSAIDVFVERFVDAFSPQVNTKAGRAGALRRAAEIRMFSPIIGDAFDAVSVAFFGRSTQDRRIEAAGFQLYPKVLRNLQQALLDPERSKAESTLVTVILLMAFESVERTSDAGVVAHLHGAVRLIQHRGPENHMYGVEHLLFTELRPYWVGAALVVRQPSFLAQEEWKTVPWSAGTTTKDILHHLLDLAVDIPSLLAQSDDFQAAIKQPEILSAHEKATQQAALWNGVTDLTDRFLRWKCDWVDLYPDGPPREVDPSVPFSPNAEDNESFPIFQCRDLRTGAVFAPSKFLYPDLRFAQTMCVYYAFRLILSTIDSRPPGQAIGPVDQYALGCGICRSLEWYILTAPGNMINRLAFPVRVAWEAFPGGGPEQRFIYDVLKLVEKRHALALWGSSMPELSPRTGSPPK